MSLFFPSPWKSFIKHHYFFLCTLKIFSHCPLASIVATEKSTISLIFYSLPFLSGWQNETLSSFVPFHCYVSLTNSQHSLLKYSLLFILLSLFWDSAYTCVRPFIPFSMSLHLLRRRLNLCHIYINVPWLCHSWSSLWRFTHLPLLLSFHLVTPFCSPSIYPAFKVHFPSSFIASINPALTSTGLINFLLLVSFTALAVLCMR